VQAERTEYPGFRRVRRRQNARHPKEHIALGLPSGPTSSPPETTWHCAELLMPASPQVALSTFAILGANSRGTSGFLPRCCPVVHWQQSWRYCDVSTRWEPRFPRYCCGGPRKRRRRRVSPCKWARRGLCQLAEVVVHTRGHPTVRRVELVERIPIRILILEESAPVILIRAALGNHFDLGTGAAAVFGGVGIGKEW